MSIKVQNKFYKSFCWKYLNFKGTIHNYRVLFLWSLNRLNLAELLRFKFIVRWQRPVFYAIIRRKNRHVYGSKIIRAVVLRCVKTLFANEHFTFKFHSSQFVLVSFFWLDEGNLFFTLNLYIIIFYDLHAKKQVPLWIFLNYVKRNSVN